MKLIDSVAVITGGSSGLGEATARYLHSLGCKIAIWDVNVSGELVAKELKSNIIFIHADVTSEESLLSALAATLKAFSKIDILVNSAGIFIGQMTITSKKLHSLENFEKIIRINTTGTFNASRIVAKQMAKQEQVGEERGVIINISSIIGIEGQRGQVAYATSKGAIIGMTLPMARDLAGYSIRVNTIAPGGMAGTGMIPTPIGEKVDKSYGVLNNRFGKPTEFAHTVQFLIENVFMNGAVIRLDGGLRMPHI